MPLIPEALLDEIQGRTDIAELIGRYVPLKRAGRHFKANCPFHKERTPSFHVNTDKQIFHCFGCGVGGNVFGFQMQQERVTFPDAVRQLAQQAGVVIPDEPAHLERSEREPLLELVEKACRFYERSLAHPRAGSAAHQYLRSRGVTAKTIEAFRLGAAPDGWDGLWQAAKKSRVAEEMIERAGLIMPGSRGWRDRFRQRVMFPIQDVRGRVIGFGGRSVADQEPKYLNSPDTVVYSKGRHLFGLRQAKEAIGNAREAIVVEGYFDCVLVWQFGIEQVVSPLGTAFTAEQARLLRRFTDHVVLAFDADAAGEAATLRGIDVLIEAGFHIRVAQLPAGVDPDEYLRAHGAEAFQRLLAQGLSMIEWLIHTATARHPLRSADARVEAAQAVLPTVAKVPNAMLRTEYLRVVAERLHLDEAAVREELARAKPRAASAIASAGSPAASPRARLQRPEELLVALIIDEPSRWNAVKDEACLAFISDERLRRVLAVVRAQQEAGAASMTPAQLISRLTEDGIGSLVSELAELAQAVPNRDDAFRSCVARLRLEARKRQRDVLLTQLKTAEQQRGHEREVDELLTSIQILNKG